MRENNRTVTLAALPGDRFDDTQKLGRRVVVTSVLLSSGGLRGMYWVQALNDPTMSPWCVSEEAFNKRFVPQAQPPIAPPTQVDDADTFVTTLASDAERLQKHSDEFAKAVNMVSAENGSNTPDFILGVFLAQCLSAFDLAMQARAEWYGKPLHRPGQSD